MSTQVCSCLSVYQQWLLALLAKCYRCDNSSPSCGKVSGNHPHLLRSTFSPPAPARVSTSTPSSSNRSFCLATPNPESPRGDIIPLELTTRWAWGRWLATIMYAQMNNIGHWWRSPAKVFQSRQVTSLKHCLHVYERGSTIVIITVNTLGIRLSFTSST